MNKNVWTIDIETSPCIVVVWGMGKQYVTHEQLIKDWHIMSFSAKKLDAPESSLLYMETRNDNDLVLLKKLWEIFNDADIIITQNGKKFDSKKINARFIMNGLPPVKPYQHIDTYLIVKNVAALTSNKLEYLTDKLCVKHKKIVHGKYPGLSLWKECEKNNIDAWNEMKRYNKKDVLSTEELYLAIKAWAPESTPKMYPLTPEKDNCTTCGYFGEMKQGRDRIKSTGVYTQNSCVKCGSWQVLKQKKDKTK